MHKSPDRLDVKPPRLDRLISKRPINPTPEPRGFAVFESRQSHPEQCELSGAFWMVKDIQGRAVP